jgi:hypothetical protein
MCPACATSTEKPWHEFRVGCDGCTARGVARGPNFRDSQKTGLLTWRYKAELEATKLTHEQVKAACAADRLGNG